MFSPYYCLSKLWISKNCGLPVCRKHTQNLSHVKKKNEKISSGLESGHDLNKQVRINFMLNYFFRVCFLHTGQSTILPDPQYCLTGDCISSLLTPRPKTLLPSNLHPPPPTIAFNMHIQAIVDGSINDDENVNK